MKKIIPILSAILAVSACGQAPEESSGPEKVIIETDMGNDIDDALALAVAYKAVDEGRLEILAIGCHKQSETPARYVDILNTWYKHPEIEVAMSHSPVKEVSNYTDYTNKVCEMDFPETRNGDFPEPVKLYRKILSEAQDKSVSFISLGFGTTLASLLESTGDEYSPLSGKELVAKKVKTLSIMAGSYGDKKRAEYNVINDIPAMQKVFSEWPGEIVQNPFEIGSHVLFPGSMVEENLGYDSPNPVAEGYKVYQEMPYDRPSWDILSVVYILEPDLFTKSTAGTVSVDDQGYTSFSPQKEGRHFVLSATIDQPQALKDYITKMAVK